MKCSHLIGIVIWLVIPLLKVSAQNDTIIHIPQVTIQATALRSSFTGDRSERWNSIQLSEYQGTHIGDLLSQESGLFIKSYGNGSLATTSIRGASAGHTKVVWNGIPLRSPMLGQLDFSLIPVSFVDELQVSYGGNTSAWGSGAIGGVLHLQNRPQKSRGLSLGTETQLGSYGRWNQHARVHWANAKVSASIRLFHQQAENDFPFQLVPDKPEERQPHAAVQQDGLLQELYWNIDSHNTLSFHTWIQHADRELPPTTVQNRSEATQVDQFLRSSLQWEQIRDKSRISGKMGYSLETLEYTNPLAGVYARSKFQTLTTEWDWQAYFNEQQSLQVGLTQTWMQARSDGYGDTRHQYLTALFASFQQQLKAWTMQMNVRQELTDGKYVPWVANLGVSGNLTPSILLKAKLSRNYRLPTLNDLYWKPGGDPDLKPEHGWSQEITLQFSGTPGTFSTDYSLTGFNRNIQDWILWALVDGQSYWSVHNLSQVWSRGIEQRLTIQKQYKTLSTTLNAGYDLIWSTNEKKITSPDLAVGQQLVYVPRHQAFAKLAIQSKAFRASYTHSFTGEVYTLNEHTLANYQQGSVYFSYTLAPKLGEISFFLSVNNLWDSTYRVIEYRAMPGRNFLGGISFYTNSTHN